MSTKSFIAAGAAGLALALAAPVAAADYGQALAPEVVPGAGLSGVAGAQATIRHVVRGSGLTAAGAASFRIDPAKVVYLDPARQLHFTSLSVASVRFVDNTATLRGIGLLNHRRVAFTAVGVHNQLPGIDAIRISWGHGAGHGGRVVRGSLFIR